MIITEKSLREKIKKLLIEGSFGRISIGGQSSSSADSTDDLKAANDYKGSDYPAENVNLVIAALKEAGFTNKHFIKGVLCVVAKESNFKPKGEKGYKNTSIDRIREVFGKNTIRVDIDDISAGTKFRSLTNDQINNLKSSNEKFFNALYGGRIGNNTEVGPSGDGNLFRGRGFNQLTGRSNYRKAGYESNPEAVNNPKDAARVVAQFMKKHHLSLYSFNERNSASNDIEGVNMAADINGGQRNKEPARKNAMARLDHFSSIDVADSKSTDSKSTDSKSTDSKSTDQIT